MLPIKILILAIGDIDQNKLGNYKKIIISHLSKLTIDIKASVEEYLK